MSTTEEIADGVRVALGRASSRLFMRQQALLLRGGGHRREDAFDGLLGCITLHALSGARVAPAVRSRTQRSRVGRPPDALPPALLLLGGILRKHIVGVSRVDPRTNTSVAREKTRAREQETFFGAGSRAPGERASCRQQRGARSQPQLTRVDRTVRRARWYTRE